MHRFITNPIGAPGAGALRLGTPLDRHYMPGSTVESWTPMLKEDYEEAYRTELPDENIAEGFMRKEIKPKRWQGKKRIVPVLVGRQHSTGSIGARGALPQAGRSSWADFEIPVRDTYARVSFDQQVIQQSRNKRGSWQDVVPTEMDRGFEDLCFHRNRMMWGYGKGILALVNGAVAASTTIVVDAPGNVAGSVLGNRFLHGDAVSGMFVAVIDPSTPTTIYGSGFVTSASVDGLSITLDTAITCPDNAWIVVAQTATQNSYNKEPEGILAGVDDGTYVETYHNLSRTTYPVLKATVVTGVGSISADAIQQPIDATAIRTNKGTDLIFGELAPRRAYLATLEQDRRYSGANLMSPDGGTHAAKNPIPKTSGGKAITFGDIPFICDPDAPFGMLFGINKESWTRYVMEDFTWDSTDGKELKWVSGFDEFTTYGRIFDNFHCHQPNRNWRMEGIDVNQIVVRRD
jgi:hypothetical protein